MSKVQVKERRKSIFDLQVHPVDVLMDLSKKKHWGFKYIGVRDPLLFPIEEIGFRWCDKRSFSKPIIKEALKRESASLEILTPGAYVQTVMGDQIDDSLTWEEKAIEFEEKLKRDAMEALPTMAKVALVAAAVGAVCAIGVGVAGAAAAATAVPAVAPAVAAPTVSAGVLPVAAAVGLLALDPKMVLVVSDGYQTHWVCICSWLD